MNWTVSLKILAVIVLMVTEFCDGSFYGSITLYKESLKLWNDQTDFQIPGCTPQLFVLFSRHATRNPSAKNIKRFESLLPPLQKQILLNIKDGKSHLKAKDFKKWEQPFDESDEQQLVDVGEDEIHDIGKRYKSRFPNLLGDKYSSKRYDFVHTTKHRTKDTAKSWGKAIFDDDFEKDDMKVNNTLLRFYKQCKKWKETIDDSNISTVEERRFKNSKVFKHMIKDISRKLGFTKSSELLSYETIDTIFEACRYQYSTDEDRHSPWCAAIDEDDAEILEYLDDLDHYWKDSYGFDLNYQQACEPVKDLLHNIQRSVSGESKMKGVFRFTHQGFMQKFYARLGLFKDPRPLTASWWSSSAFPSTCANSSTTDDDPQDSTASDSDVGQRQYRLSKIGPFTANIAFVLYNCTDGHKIKTFVQEREVKLPECSDALCDLYEFQEAYQDIARGCDIRSLCDYNYL